MSKTKIIVDYDNTMGLENKDIDDGIALLYLMGRDDVEIVGITLTDGNADVDEIEKSHKTFARTFGLEGIPVYSRTKAAKFMSRATRSKPKQINILAIGSMTNLHNTYMIDSDFYKNTKRIVVMGGVCEPLVYNGNLVNETNLSHNPEAAFSVLTSDADISVLNGHTGLKSFMPAETLSELLDKEGQTYDNIKNSTKSWLNKMDNDGIKGFMNWDTAAAALLLNPEWFSDEEAYISPNIKNLKLGMLCPTIDREAKKIHMPESIKDPDALNQNICDMIVNFHNKQLVFYKQENTDEKTTAGKLHASQ